MNAIQYVSIKIHVYTVQIPEFFETKIKLHCLNKFRHGMKLIKNL